MSTVTKSARGASAYTQSNYSSFQPDDTNQFARAWTPVVDELLRIRNLEDDWDGEGTEAPHPALVDGSITLAQDFQAKGMAPPDHVYVGVNSTIFFEWCSSLGSGELEVISPTDAEFRWIPKGSNRVEVTVLSRQS